MDKVQVEFPFVTYVTKLVLKFSCEIFHEVEPLPQQSSALTTEPLHLQWGLLAKKTMLSIPGGGGGRVK